MASTIKLITIPALLTLLTFILVQQSSPCDGAMVYRTFEIVKYCKRRQSSSLVVNDSPSNKQNEEELREKYRKKFNSYGKNLDLIVQEHAKSRDTDGDGHDEDEDRSNINSNNSAEYLDNDSSFAEEQFGVTKEIMVDDSYDRSAIRVVISKKSKVPIYRNWQHCAIFVRAKRPSGLIVTIDKLRLRPGTDWLRLSINNGTFVREFSHVTIDDVRDSVAYVANHGVLIEFETGYSIIPPTSDNQVELILTTFREADLCQIENEFDCGSFRCISSHYLCDGVNNCGDGRDEIGCPIDNITNYIIISTTLLLVSFLIFLCLCYRCCCQKRRPQRKQYQYVKIRTSSTSGLPRHRSTSIRSEADAGVPSALRRFKVTHLADSMPILAGAIPSAPPPLVAGTSEYGSNGNTYLQLPPQYHHQYQYFNPNMATIGVIPPAVYRQMTAGSNSGNHHNTFPLPQPTYPGLHPQLFTPPPPPPYTPRSENQPPQNPGNTN